jgi:osmotically-inducible protein OsmY
VEIRDQNLARKAKELLEEDRELSNFRIHVEVREAVVHLYGRVENKQQTMDAERLVEAVIGVLGVVNHLVFETEETAGEKD